MVHKSLILTARPFRRVLLASLTLISLLGSLYAQDTVRFMSYNLLLYGGSQTGCTPNTTSQKNPFFSTIIGATRPDIICANEIGDNVLHAENIKVNVLQPINANYERTDMLNPTNSNLVNFLFYRGDKFGLLAHRTIGNPIRDAQVYEMYYKDANLTQGSDTVKFCVVCAHLKAGNDGSSALSRAGQAADIMNFLDGYNQAGNYFVMGDMNTYRASEDAYQNFVTHTNTDTRMYDPINRMGSWNGNSSYADVHTQSTRSGSQGDCGSAGGLDDRFDHIMVSESVKDGLDGMGYLSGTYHAYGNDGQHFNKSINASPTNTAVSAGVANALLAMSDHLPVIADFEISTLAVGIPATLGSGLHIKVLGNPVEANIRLRAENHSGRLQTVTLRLTDVLGRNVELRQTEIQPGNQELNMQVAGLENGVYLLEIKAEDGSRIVEKLIKN